MALLKSLDEPYEMVTAEGKIRVTHEAYCYTIVPFAFPPVQIKTVKGHIDRMGRFKPLLPMVTAFEVSQEEFRALISPTTQGKPAGDFRISDIVSMWRKRSMPPETQAKPAAPESPAPAPEGATAVASAPAAPAKPDPETKPG